MAARAQDKRSDNRKPMAGKPLKRARAGTAKPSAAPPSRPRQPAAAAMIAKRITAAIAAGDLLTVFYSNLSFHQVLFGLCGNSCLIETIDWLAQKVYGTSSCANAFPESLERARRDHLDMINALRGSRRDELIALTRRHLVPSPHAYIRDYERRFGKAEVTAAH
jgi:DNA-binding GntR family transcriptional regulator